MEKTYTPAFDRVWAHVEFRNENLQELLKKNIEQITKTTRAELAKFESERTDASSDLNWLKGNI